MNQKILLATLALGTLPFAARPAVAAKGLTALCNVSEILAASGGSRTTVFRFHGTLETNHLNLSLLPGLSVSLKGAPAAVGDTQAFYLLAKIEDRNSGVTSLAEGYFEGTGKYSDSFHSVIAGSLDAHLLFANGDKVEVSCFNPKN